jgi:hypothetical protein
VIVLTAGQVGGYTVVATVTVVVVTEITLRVTVCGGAGGGHVGGGGGAGVTGTYTVVVQVSKTVLGTHSPPAWQTPTSPRNSSAIEHRFIVC